MELKPKRYTLLSVIPIVFRACPWIVIMKGIFLAINSFLPVITVYATAALIEAAIAWAQGTGGRDALVIPLILMMAMAVFGMLENAINQIAMIHQRLRLYEIFRLAITDRRARLKYAYVENNDTYDLIQRVSTQPAERISDTLDDGLWLVSMLMHLVSLMVVLFINVGWLAFIIIAVAIPAQYVAMKNGQKSYTGFVESEKINRRAQYLGEISTQRDAVDERTMFRFSKAINARFVAFGRQAYSVLEKTNRSVNGRKTVSDIMLLLVSIGITGVLAYSALRGDTSVAMFVALTGMIFTLVQYTSGRIPWLIHKMTERAAYFRDLTEFTALETVDGAESPPAGPQTLQRIEFRNVQFAYPGRMGEQEAKLPTSAGVDGHQVLKGVNFTIEPGKHYAIVGANGAGKSTIIKLLTGLYPEYTGEILVNGRELRSIPPAELKAFFAVAYQDFARYGVSLKDNIAIGQIGHSEVRNDSLSRAFELLDINEICEELPNGPDTIINREVPDGQELSGGQWQRVALARVFVSPAPVVILDEPTAALDPISESNVYRRFEEVSSPERTTIFISHRLGSTKLADEIIVLENGRVAQQGSHNNLMASTGLYAQMYNAQRSWYE